MDHAIDAFLFQFLLNLCFMFDWDESHQAGQARVPGQSGRRDGIQVFPAGMLHSPGLLI